MSTPPQIPVVPASATPSGTSIEPPANGAQSPAPSPASFQHGANGERTFTAADLEKARQQEKDKLYSQLESMQQAQKAQQEFIATIQKEREDAAAKAEQEEKDRLAAEKAKQDAELSAKDLLEQKLRETNDTWEQKFKELADQRALEKATADKERAYQELVNYRNSQITEAGDDIAPQFHDFITGETKEAIQAGIERAKAATLSIAQQVAVAQQQQRSQMRGVAPTGLAPIGPLDNNSGQQTYTPEQLQNMSMKEYAEFRQKSGFANSEAQRNRGLYG